MKKLLMLVVCVFLLQVSVLGIYALESKGSNSPRKSEPPNTKFTTTVNVCLPNGDVAPKGGMELLLTAYNNYYDSSTYKYSYNEITTKNVLVPEGQNSTKTVIDIPELDKTGLPVDSYKLKFETLQDYGYFKSGFIFTQRYDFTSDIYRAKSFQSSATLTLNLFKQLTVKGTVSLPDNLTAPSGGLDVKLSLTSKMQELKTETNPEEDDYRYYDIYGENQVVHIPEGKNQATYSIDLVLPHYYYDWSKNEDEIFFNKLELSYSTVLKDPQYLPLGYYNDGKTDAVSSSSIFHLLNKGNTIDITLIRATNISGTISLPKGDKAPKGGISLSIYANKFSTDILIPEGGNSAKYSVYIPQEPNKYKVEYRLKDHTPGYMYHAMYYNGSSSIVNQKYTKVDTSKGSVANINFPLLKEGIIQGYIKLPDGVTAHKGLGYTIYAVNDTEIENDDEFNDAYIEKYRCNVIIEKGQNKVPYKILIPCDKGYVDKGYCLRYDLNDNYFYSVYINVENPIEITKGAVNYDITVNYRKRTHTVSGYVASNSREFYKTETFIVSGSDWYTNSVKTDSKGYFKIDVPDNTTLFIGKNGHLHREIKIPDNLVNMQIGTEESPIELWAGDISEEYDGELHSDGAINMYDIEHFKKWLNAVPGKPEYKSCFDFDSDGIITMRDIMIVARNFDKTTASYPEVNIISVE